MDELEFLDEVKLLTIVAMSSDDRLMEELVLKGGNAMDLIYGASARASADLDFSMGEEFEPAEALRDRIARCLSSTFQERGYVVFDVTIQERPPQLTDDLRDFWGGFLVEFKLTSASTFARYANELGALRKRATRIGENNSTKFRIDISKHEFTGGKTSVDIRGFRVFVYTPEMIVCEKVRAICQQMAEYASVVKRTRLGAARARDFVDIHALCEKFGVDFASPGFQSSLRNAFAIKRVPIFLVRKFPDYREFHRPDFTSVRDTVKVGFALRDFDFYFDYVVEKCRALEPLRDEDSPL